MAFPASAHLGAVLLFSAAYAGSAVRLHSSRQIRGKILYALLMAAFFPGLGAWMALIFFVAARSGAKQVAAASEEEFFGDKKWLSRLALIDEGETPAHLQRRMRTEIGFRPMIDIIRGQETQAKTKAIFLLSRSMSREHVALLKEALRDGVPEIRLYAASALLKIEAELNRRIQQAKAECERRGNFGDYAQLGDLYATYAGIGIADPSLASYYLGRSAEAFRSSLDIYTEQPDSTLKLSRVLLELRQYDKVRGLLDRAVRVWPGDKEMVFLRNEVYFNLGRFEDIGAYFSGLSPEGLTEAEKGVTEFWTTLKNR